MDANQNIPCMKTSLQNAWLLTGWAVKQTHVKVTRDATQAHQGNYASEAAYGFGLLEDLKAQLLI